MTDFRYPADALRGDYARAGAGLVVCLLPIVLVDLHWIVFAVLAGAALLFALFLVRTVQRQSTRVEMDELSISAKGPGGRTIAWSTLDALKLRFYSTRRDRSHGWMQMTLRGAGTSITLESTLDGFEQIAARAYEAARHRGLDLSETTQENLAALGIGIRDGDAREGDGPEEDWITALRRTRQAQGDGPRVQRDGAPVERPDGPQRIECMPS